MNIVRKSLGINVTSPSLNRRRGRDEQQTPPGKQPHEHNQKNKILELKAEHAYIDAKLLNHTAEATQTHLQH